MDKQDYTPDQFLTYDYLNSLDSQELLDLLLHRSKLFMAAITSRMADKGYIQTIQKEIEMIHETIKSKSKSKSI